MPSSHVRYKQSTQRGEKKHPEQQKVPNFKLLLHPPPCWVCALCVYPTPKPCPPGVSSSVLSNEPRCKVSSPPQNNSRLPSKENPQNSDAKKAKLPHFPPPENPFQEPGSSSSTRPIASHHRASHCRHSPPPPPPQKRGQTGDTPAPSAPSSPSAVTLIAVAWLLTAWLEVEHPPGCHGCLPFSSHPVFTISTL